MRTTVDLPEPLFRRTKAVAALRGSTLKELIIQAVEKEVSGSGPQSGKRLKLPLVRLPKGKTVNLSGFDFDDLLT